MRWFSLAGLALVPALGFTACATSTATKGTQTADAETQTADAQPVDDQASAELKEHHWHHHRGGVTQFIAMSLDTLGTDDAKRAQIEALQSDLYTCMAPAGDTEKKLHLTLADGIAAGAIDTAKVDATISQLDAAAAPVHDCNVKALNQLHAVLSPIERSELVEKVKAHWEVWRQVNPEAKAGAHERGGRLAVLAKELSLTPDQVDKIAAALHTTPDGHAGKFDRKKVDEHVQAFGAAFVSDSFDAKSITSKETPRLATHGATRMAIFYETVTPLLTPDQRATLAEHLREHAGHQPVISAK